MFLIHSLSGYFLVKIKMCAISVVLFQSCWVELSALCTSFELTPGKRAHSEKESPIGIKVFNVGNSFSWILSGLRFTLCQGSKQSQTSPCSDGCESIDFSWGMKFTSVIRSKLLFLRNEVYFWSLLLKKKSCFLVAKKLWYSISFKPSTSKLVSLWRNRYKKSRFWYHSMIRK